MNLFYKKKEVNLSRYKDSKIYKIVNLSKENEKNFLIKLISSYENFINYLDQEDVLIDYNYLWI